MDDELGIVTYGEKQGSASLGADIGMTRNYSEESAKKIDQFVRDTINTQYKRAAGILKQHEKKLHELAIILLKDETMSVEEFVAIFEGKPVPPKKIVKKAEDELKEIEKENE
jgi:cell division protease FtsH